MDKFYLVLIAIASFLLLGELYTLLIRSGKLIIKGNRNKNKSYFIIWLILLIIGGIALGLSVKGYIKYKADNYESQNYMNNIMSYIFWVVLCIYNVIRSFIGSQIRENGLYIDCSFYKWDKVQNYEWTSPNTIWFKMNTFLKVVKTNGFIVTEDLKSKVDETVQRNVG